MTDDLSYEARTLERCEKRIAALKAELADDQRYIARLRSQLQRAHETLCATGCHDGKHSITCDSRRDTLAGGVDS